MCVWGCVSPVALPNLCFLSKAKQQPELHVCGKQQSLQMPRGFPNQPTAVCDCCSSEINTQAHLDCDVLDSLSHHQVDRWRLVVRVAVLFLHRPQAVLDQLKGHLLEMAGHVGKREVRVAVAGKEGKQGATVTSAWLK